MPIYEYDCQECGQEFSLTRSMTEQARGGARCPHCGSERVTQKVSLFMAQTSRKS